MRVLRNFLENKELSTIGEFYSRVYLFDVFHNESLKRKHHSFSINEWETFVFDMEHFVDDLVKHLMEVISYSCKCEFRHFGNQLTYSGNLRDKFIEEFINNCGEYSSRFSTRSTLSYENGEPGVVPCNSFNLQEHYTREESVKVLDKVFSKSEEADLMYRILSAFRDYKWEQFYGGKKWADGVNAWFLLKNAKSLKSKIVAIDHAYDLQHNTGLLLNKDKRYEEIENEISNYLTTKRYARNLSEILHKRGHSNQYVRRENIFCYPRSYKTLLKFGHKMGILV